MDNNNKNRFFSVVDQISKLATADDYEIYFWAENSSLTRFAENMVTQNVTTENEKVYLTCYFGGKKAMLTSENLTTDGIKRLVSRCEEVAKLSVVDKEYVPSAHHIDQKDGPGIDVRVKNLTPTKRAEMANIAIKEAKKGNLTAFGTVDNSFISFGIATKNGARKFYEDTSANIKNTLDLNGEKTSASQSVTKYNDLSPQSVFDEAHHDLMLTGERKDFEPGRYKVLLSSKAAAELYFMMGFVGMDRRAHDEGYSPYSGKIGQKLIDSRISFFTDPYYEELPTVNFCQAGLPLKRKYIFENGTLKNIPVTRYWGKEKNLDPWMIRNLVMTGSDQSDQELIKKIDRGFYIKDLWYVRVVKMQDLTMTGMTRNGFFYVEDGKIQGGAKHFRWNDSPLSMLDRLIDTGRSVRSPGWGHCPMLIPSLLIDDFYLSSKTKF